MGHMIKAACIQMNSGADIQKNLERAGELIRSAAGEGARLILTPEVTDQVISNRAEVMEQSFAELEHPGIPFFSALVQELGVDLIVGSMSVKRTSGKIANRSFGFNACGKIVEKYDKIHLYDVDLPNGESHRESKIFEAGDKAILMDVQGVKLGLTICYDIRFPQLYRNLAQKGAQIITAPAAFTVPTGQAHWETLLRARAIETGSFILAAGQCGDHDGARQTYGHSMIIGPWGDILAQMETGEGYIVTDLDLNLVDKARQAIPALDHDKIIL